MYKVLYGIAGGATGCFISYYGSAFLMSFVGSVFLISFGRGVIVVVPVIGAIIGLIIGIVLGAKADKEKVLAEKRQAEEAARQVEEQERIRKHEAAVQAEKDALEKWVENQLTPVLESFNSIQAFIENDENQNPKAVQPFYDLPYAQSCQNKLMELKSAAERMDRAVQFVSYSKTLSSKLKQAIDSIDKEIRKEINDFAHLNFDYRLALPAFICSIAYMTGDEKYMRSANAAYQFCVSTFQTLTTSDLSEYGNYTTPVDTDEKMDLIASQIDTIERRVKDTIAKLSAAPDQYYSCIADVLYREWPQDAETMMWYYAKKKPFDTEKFEEACRYYAGIGHMGHNTPEGEIPNTIEMIARIYSKQAIGGETTVEADKKVIEQWLFDKTDNGENKAGQKLASALAWMELYRMEYYVLKQLVQLRVQLHENVQNRLRFLSEGGTSNIKVYDIEPSSSFMFDSSSENWKEAEISICFRNLKMKKIIPHYSLVISSWKKTMPLVSGQKVDQDKMFAGFNEMVDDFDGEVICEHVDAKAIDLANVEYPNATLFRFTTERNRCISIIYHSEKFGRNLNITILTLFTPDEGLTLEEMEKYALAIKSNVYVNSFRESILQTVDETIKVEATIYDDTSLSSSSTIFE